jgi:hypothetical protein
VPILLAVGAAAALITAGVFGRTWLVIVLVALLGLGGAVFCLTSARSRRRLAPAGLAAALLLIVTAVSVLVVADGGFGQHRAAGDPPAVGSTHTEIAPTATPGHTTSSAATVASNPATTIAPAHSETNRRTATTIIEPDPPPATSTSPPTVLGPVRGLGVKVVGDGTDAPCYVQYIVTWSPPSTGADQVRSYSITPGGEGQANFDTTDTTFTYYHYTGASINEGTVITVWPTTTTGTAGPTAQTVVHMPADPCHATAA